MEKFEKREKIDRKKKEQESAEAISGLKITTTNIPLYYEINFAFLDHCTLYLLSIYLCIYVYFIAYLYPSFLCEIKQKFLMNRHTVQIVSCIKMNYLI